MKFSRIQYMMDCVLICGSVGAASFFLGALFGEASVLKDQAETEQYVREVAVADVEDDGVDLCFEEESMSEGEEMCAVQSEKIASTVPYPIHDAHSAGIYHSGKHWHTNQTDYFGMLR